MTPALHDLERLRRRVIDLFKASAYLVLIEPITDGLDQTFGELYGNVDVRDEDLGDLDTMLEVIDFVIAGEYPGTIEKRTK